MSDGKETRRYRKRKRAKLEARTRRRITEVLVELHGSVGPAGTTVTEVAERAGVSRMTVYNHFPNDAAMFEACSAHWFSLNPLPDPDEWLELDSGERLRSGLHALYCWYRENQDMMQNVLRDAAIVPALGELMDDQWWPYIDRVVDILAGAWPEDGQAPERRAALRLVVHFRAWKVMDDSGLTDSRAAKLAFGMVNCGTTGARRVHSS